MQYQGSGKEIHMIRVMLIMLLMLMATFFFNACRSHQANGNSEPVREGNLLRSTEARNTSPTYSESDLAQLVADNNTFAFELYHAVKEGIENMMY